MKNYYKENSEQTTVAQLQQLTHLTHDGDLISKSERDKLVRSELAYRPNGGWNLVTEKGIRYLEDLGFIAP